jgi:hypothetical protein
MFKKPSTNPVDIQNELTPDFMDFNYFLNNDKVKTYAEPDAYHKSKLSVLKTLYDGKKQDQSKERKSPGSKSQSGTCSGKDIIV